MALTIWDVLGTGKYCDQPWLGIQQALLDLIPFYHFVLDASIIIANSLHADVLLTVRQVPGFHGRAGQEQIQYGGPNNGYRSQDDEQDPPAGNADVCFANPVCQDS